MEQKTREEVAVRSRRQRMKAGVQWRWGVVVSIPYNNPIESNLKKKNVLFDGPKNKRHGGKREYDSRNKPCRCLCQDCLSKRETVRIVGK